MEPAKFTDKISVEMINEVVGLAEKLGLDCQIVLTDEQEFFILTPLGLLAVDEVTDKLN